MIKDPQNPYDSYMVEASAGTGKTYQLTQRFLFLVGAGADPSSILAITFTVKAVQEMHSRIILEASKLLVDEKQQKNFERKLKLFYQDFIKNQDQKFKLNKPRTALETAKTILSSTQRLKITTIDSIFYEWVIRFPSEANIEGSVEKVFERSVSLTESLDVEMINKKAWEEVFKKDEMRAQFFSCYEKIKNVFPSKGLLSVQSQAEELFRYMLHIFYLQKIKESAYLAYDEGKIKKNLPISEKDLLLQLKDKIFVIVNKITKKEKILEALKKNSLDSLVENRFLTQNFSVSKALVKGSKRESLIDEIDYVESHLKDFYNRRAKAELKVVGENLFGIYQLWYEARLLLKKKMRSYEFSDLSMGCYNLFNSDENTSVLWLLQKSINHILIDEFQDTSMVQWAVFSKILEEIMSVFEDSTKREGYRTSFIVGDRKQSIYGFREADPYVMDLASSFFKHYGKNIVSLNKSYRTSSLIMDFVTRFFSEEIDKDFPVHETAQTLEGDDVIPNVSKIFMSKLFEPEGDESKTALELEAESLANFLDYVFNHSEEYLIFDKKNQSFRKIRYSDCCVLYRNATHVDAFIKALEEKKIPYKKENENSFFDKQEIISVLGLLRFFVDGSDIHSLMIFLRAGFLEVSETLIIELLDKTKDLDKDERAHAILEILQKRGYDFEKIMALKDDSLFCSPHKILLGLYEKVFYSDEKDKVAEKSLIKLLDLVLEIESKGFNTLQETLQELDKMTLHKVQGGDEGSLDSISLMTIHKSKGLEFPFVALIETADSWFKFDRYWLKSSEGIYYCGTSNKMPKEDKNFQEVYQQTQSNMYQETIRLLYVALTRTSQYLYISAHKVRSSQTMGFYSSLLSCFKRSENLKSKGEFYFIESTVDNKKIISEEKVKKEERRDEEDFFIASSSQDLRIVNPHSFITHDESEGFYPSKSCLSENVRALLGTFVHKALELYFSSAKLDLKKMWQQMITRNSLYMREGLSSKFSESLYLSTELEIQKNILSKEFQNLFAKAFEVVCEMPVVSLDKASLLLGSIDLFIRKDEKNIFIVDYKTSECDSETNLEEFCLKRNYHKQLFSYKGVISKIYPECQVSLVLWLTKVQKGVFLK